MAGFGAKLGQQIGRYFEAMAPMAGKQARGALGLGTKEVMEEGTAYWASLKNQWKAMKTKPAFSDKVRGYLKGWNMEDMLYQSGDFADDQLVKAGFLKSSEVERKRRQFTRFATLGASGVVGLNAMFGSEENMVGRATGFAARVGMHGGIGWGMQHLGHPLLGKGYWAWAGINMLRGGDNFGPF
jgi:hypothetical protein